MAKALSLHLPGNFGTVIFGTIIVSALYALSKVFVTYVKVYTFRQTLSRSIVKNHTFSDVFKSLNLANKVVVLHEGKPFAYCFGIRRPKIFITTGLISLVNKKELGVILRHEKYHLEHRDNLILLLATFVKSLFPFFPILSDLIRMYKTDRELLADRAAIQETADRRSLSSILKKLLQFEQATIPTLAMAIADIDTLETRIKALLSIKVAHRSLGKKNLFLSIIFVVVLTTLMGTPIHAVELHNNDVDVMIVCNKNASCESACKDHSIINFQNTAPTYISNNFSAYK